MSNLRPLVSVAIITYNHERFITKAIESVLAQRTRFPIEIVIGDDASSDGTSRQVEALRARAPDLIRALIRPVNIGMHKNVESVVAECRGEFIAFLEGDDYWMSDEKLQLQADVLRENDKVVGVFHPAVTVDPLSRETGEIWPDRALSEIGTRALLKSNLIPTASVMVRREALVSLPESYRELKMRDWPMWVFASLYGCWRCLPEVMAAYRVHDRGNWNSLNGAARREAKIELFRRFAVDLPRPFRNPARRQLARARLDALWLALAEGRAADARRQLHQMVPLFLYYRIADLKCLVSVLWQFASPRTHAPAKRTLSLLRQKLRMLRV